MNYKIAFWIVLVLLLLETSLFIWGYTTTVKQENRTLECYYNVCAKYPEAELVGKVCYCEDYDLLGNLVVKETKLLD